MELGLETEEVELLKSCLGDADGNTKNNARFKSADSDDALYNWDYGISDTIKTDNSSFVAGSFFHYNPDELLNPHLIKVVMISYINWCCLPYNLKSTYYSSIEYLER